MNLKLVPQSLATDVIYSLLQVKKTERNGTNFNLMK